MDFSSAVLTDVYKKLGRWIYQCKATLDSGGYLETILGRKFHLADAKNERAVLNGVMQGSVAHAMQHTVRRIWERFPQNLVAEIHDSLVLCCSRETPTIKSLINSVVPIMSHPFEGLLADNPIFPLKVSVGARWKEWKYYKTYRGQNAKTDCEEYAQGSEKGFVEKVETSKEEEAMSEAAGMGPY